MFTAEFKDGRWQNWKYAGDKLNKEYQIGELPTLNNDGNIYFTHHFYKDSKMITEYSL